MSIPTLKSYFCLPFYRASAPSGKLINSEFILLTQLQNPNSLIRFAIAHLSCSPLRIRACFPLMPEIRIRPPYLSPTPILRIVLALYARLCLFNTDGRAAVSDVEACDCSSLGLHHARPLLHTCVHLGQRHSFPRTCLSRTDVGRAFLHTPCLAKVLRRSMCLGLIATSERCATE